MRRTCRRSGGTAVSSCSMIFRGSIHRRIRYLPFHAALDLYSRGQYQFTSGIFSGNPLANLLLGLPTNALRLTGNTTRNFRTWATSLYLQHNWRPYARLSVNLGLRYDYQTPFRERDNLVLNFDEV